MSAKTYRKVVVSQFAAEVRASLQIVETPRRDPRSNEIIVRNSYAGVNFSDLPLTMGRRPNFVKLPFDLGVEAAGEVVAVGNRVTDFQPGDNVLTVMFGNAFREYSEIDEKLALKVDDLSPEILALVMSGARASIALEIVAKMQRHDPLVVLVTAAAGGSGHYAVQLAKLDGHHVVGTVGSDEEVAMLQGLGCDRIINRSREDMATVLKSEYPNGVNLVYESFGGKFFDVALDSLAPRGRMLLVDTFAEHSQQNSIEHSISLYDKIIWKSASIHGFSLVEYAQFIRAHAQIMMKLRADGKIRSILDPKPFKGLEQVVDALEHVQNWRSRGKVIIAL